MKPNVLLLIVDDLRTDIGSYGKAWARTPAMDALAARSVTFLQAHAALANCAPSRSSVLTGLRPDTHGVLDLVTHVRDRHPRLKTLPQCFREAGYLTISYGKIFHQFLDDGPSWSPQQDFRDNHTYRGLRGAAWGRAGGWHRGWRYNQYMLPENLAKQRETQARRRRGDYSMSINGAVPPYEIGPDGADGEYTDARLAVRAIRALRLLHAQPRPWFLAVGFIRPHLPFNAPGRFWKAAVAAEGALDAEAQPIPGLSTLTAAHLRGGDGELYDFAGPRRVAAASDHGRGLARAYAAAVSFVDGQCGRVVGALGAAANGTVVVLLSDHGWKLGHHGGWGKHTLLAADTHVPLMVSAPGYASKRVHAPVELVDLYPTLLELAGLPQPRRSRHQPPLAGRTLLPLMRRRTPRQRLTAAAAYSQWPIRRPMRCMGYAVRTQGWLLIQWAADPHQRPPPSPAEVTACEASADLFRVRRNLSHPGEIHESLLSASRPGSAPLGHPAVVSRLRRRLRRVMGLTTHPEAAESTTVAG